MGTRVLCPECNSDSVLTLSSQVCGTVTVRRRQCRACSAEWLARVTEEIIQGSIVLAKSVEKPTELNIPGQKPSSGQNSGSESSLTLFQGLRSSGPSEQDPSKGERDEPPPLLTFPTVGRARMWHFTVRELRILTDAFPGLEVMDEARKALGWVQANARQRKTPDGMSRFLFGWMSRAQNSGRRPAMAGGMSEREARGAAAGQLFVQMGRKTGSVP